MRIIPIGDPAAPYRSPDLVFDGVIGDLALNPLSHETAPGDFRAEQGLATQVLICLMTDARVDESELPAGEVNRGFVGDTFDTGPYETPIGSKLWLLRCAALTDDTIRRAEDYARAALQTLIDQGVAASVTVAVTADKPTNRLDLDVGLYARSGERIFSERYALLWDQIKRG